MAHKRIVCLLVAALVLLPLVSNVALGQEKPTIVFGAALPLTGELAPEGEKQMHGYEFWKETVNAQGGIDVGGTKYLVDIILRLQERYCYISTSCRKTDNRR